MNIPKTLEIPITENSPEVLKTYAEFLDIMDRTFDKNKNLLQYAKDLDAYSTTTFNHSVNVALQFYNAIRKNPELSQEEKEEWTISAFVHDAGKLTTPLNVLHSKVNYRKEDGTQNLELMLQEKKIMMEHSINGLDTAKKYGFSDRMIFAVIGHHVNTEAIEKGPQCQFEGASKSKDTWEASFSSRYGDHPIENVLMSNCSWITQKDKTMVETLSVIDGAEAMRSTDRVYRPNQKSWEEVYKLQCFDLKKGALNKNLVNSLTNNDAYKNSFDELQSFNSPDKIRYMIFEKGKDLPYVLSGDKIAEIFNNPQYGIPFFKEEKDGSFVIDTGDGNYFDVLQKEELPLIIKKAKPSIYVISSEINEPGKVKFSPVQEENKEDVDREM